MKRTGKAVFFIVLGLILVITTLAFTGVHTWYGDLERTWIKGARDIRWGIDIRGGVDVTFSPPKDYDAPDDEMAAAEAIIKVRLVSLNITDYEVYTDVNKDRIIVRFPWKEGETDFNPEKAIQELGETAMLTFREGVETDTAGAPTGVTKDTIILQGQDVTNAAAAYSQNDYQQSIPVVSLKLSPDGTKKFADATARLQGGVISIWMDETLLSAPTVQNVIDNGEAIVTGMESIEAAKDLADKINAGALPFKLITDNYSTISPTLGEGARDAMMIAGIIAFAIITILMISMYRLPGIIAVFSLVGQVGLMFASITGFFSAFPSFTLTLPGIAGIILSVGFGVDANVITAERIREELKTGKTIDGAITAGFSRAFTAIFDGNITVIIVAVVLLGAFGTPGSFFSTLLYPVFFMFGPSTSGNIYSFGYTLLVGVILNFVMGVMASRLMLKSISRFGPFRNPWLY
ncbi:MAG: MMPL family transporter [Oscillospiraceae bacterium]|jgi:protein-export membrane protein SecD|nr:MMPL family transporter [Oscillospiraceae bacterium]